jgi:hypothetical protein
MYVAHRIYDSSLTKTWFVKEKDIIKNNIFSLFEFHLWTGPCAWLFGSLDAGPIHRKTSESGLSWLFPQREKKYFFHAEVTFFHAGITFFHAEITFFHAEPKTLDAKI